MTVAIQKPKRDVSLNSDAPLALDINGGVGGLNIP